MMWGYGMGGFWMVLVWVGIILAIVWAVQGSRGSSRSRRRSALEILEERYARGDIERDDYLTRRLELESQG